MGKQADVRIDVNALATELESMISPNNLSMSSLRCCIFRVPNTLLRQNPKAYEPNAFSIGPFHYDKPHLKAMQKIKFKYLHDFISRCPNKNPEALLRELMGKISEVGEEARECYEQPFNMSMEEFIKVLVLDGCFLIELFRKFTYQYPKKETQKDYDPIFSVSSVQQVLNHDLILLENQIPWFVLEHLFNMTKTLDDDQYPLTTLVNRFFNDIFSISAKLGYESLTLAKVEPGIIKHILDLIRFSVCVNIRKHQAWSWMTAWEPMPSATRLREAGIKFKRATRATTILDVEFKNGVLEIPPLNIHDRTESLFRNLICLEQCLPNCYGIITSYAILLDNLIHNVQDMEILCKNEVIDNWLHNKAAVEFFNKLFNDIDVKDVCFFELTQAVNDHCQLFWPRHRTTLMRNYFRNPWALISVIVGAILLILAFLQTLFTIIK